ERIQDLRAQKKDTTELEIQLASTLQYLAKRNIASASTTLESLDKTLAKLNQPSPTPTNTQTSQTKQTAPSTLINNTPPSSGYSRQTVHSEIGAYTVDIVSADLTSTRVIVDT